jgi:hypothetical protein
MLTGNVVIPRAAVALYLLAACLVCISFGFVSYRLYTAETEWLRHDDTGKDTVVVPIWPKSPWPTIPDFWERQPIPLKPPPLPERTA